MKKINNIITITGEPFSSVSGG